MKSEVFFSFFCGIPHETEDISENMKNICNDKYGTEGVYTIQK